MLVPDRTHRTNMHKVALTLLVTWALVLQAVFGTAGLAAQLALPTPLAGDICHAGGPPDGSGWPAAPTHRPDDPCCALACLTKGLVATGLLPRMVAVAVMLVWHVAATPVRAGRPMTRPLGPPPRPLGSRAPPAAAA